MAQIENSVRMFVPHKLVVVVKWIEVSGMLVLPTFVAKGKGGQGRRGDAENRMAETRSQIWNS